MCNTTLKEAYNSVVQNYVLAFCDKHELDINDGYWIGDEIGGIYEIADYFFGFKDIKFDIDERVDERFIWDWYDYSLKVAEISDGAVTCAYEDWLKGKRPFTKNDIEKIELAKQHVEEAKAILEESIKEALGSCTDKCADTPGTCTDNCAASGISSPDTAIDLGKVYDIPRGGITDTSEVGFLIEELRRNGSGSFMYGDTLYYVENGHVYSKYMPGSSQYVLNETIKI